MQDQFSKFTLYYLLLILLFLYRVQNSDRIKSNQIMMGRLCHKISLIWNKINGINGN